MLSNSEIANFCCDEHNKAYIGARERARLADTEWTPEVLMCLDAITFHRAELRAELDKNAESR